MADTTSLDQTAQAPKGATPPNSSTKPDVSGTPIAANRSGMQVHASANQDRQDTFESFRCDISGKIIGPMPVKDFLKTFLPSDSAPVACPETKMLEEVNKAPKETEMYAPFIAAFENYVTSGARFADSHTAALASWDKSPISPDVVLLDNSLDTTWLPGDTPTLFEDRPIESIGVMLEFKLKGTASDPFTDDPDAESFEIRPKDGETSKDYSLRGQTLGQICAYATAHMANQFRTHVFSVLIFRNYARILYWDRAGVVVTEKINLTSAGAQPLAEFFSRYACATPVKRGVDPNVEQMSERDLSLIDDKAKAGLVKDSNSPFYKITLFASSDVSKSKSYIVAVPQFMGAASPTGRSTRIFRAYDMKNKNFVFMKDSWRIIGGSLKPEHERYSALAAAGVRRIPTVVDYHDMESQQTRTSLKLHDTKRGTLPNKFRKFQHYRLVLKEYAKPLEEFKDVKELLTAISDAIQAHSEAFHRAQILHRDISVGNIMIDQNGRGLLIDWDLSKCSTETDDDSEPDILPERTGTWQFISYNLGGQRDPDEPKPIHSKEDDLESFFHVLHWLALRACEHKQKINQVKITMRDVYDTALRDVDGPAAPLARRNLFFHPRLIADIRFGSPALKLYLTEFHKVVSQRYIVEEEFKDLLIRWRDDIVEARPETSDEDIISELDRRMKANRKAPISFPQYIIPGDFLQSLEIDWAPKLYEDLFGSGGKDADWTTGNANVFPSREAELSTRAKLALFKRKSDSSDNWADADDGKQHTKKPRMDSGLPSVHEEAE